MAFSLVPCSICSRHVRENEAKCPFCQSRRLQRRAAIALAAVAVGGTVWACGGSAAPAYGLACLDDCTRGYDATTWETSDGRVPANPDVGEDAAADASDAPHDAPDAD